MSNEGYDAWSEMHEERGSLFKACVTVVIAVVIVICGVTGFIYYLLGALNASS